MPLNIIVIGAGLGGLTAAYILASHQHTVHVLERKPALTAKGGSLMVRPNASRFLAQWGLQPACFAISDPSAATVYRDAVTDEVLRKRYPTATDGDWGTTRQALIAVIYARACAAGAEVRFGVGVRDIDSSANGAEVTLENGTYMNADLVLVADGVSSRLRSKVLGGERIEPVVIGSTFYQIKLPESRLRGDVRTTSLADTPELTVWMTEGGFVVGRYNTKLHEINVIYAIPNESIDSDNLWDASGDIEHVRKHFSRCDARVTTILSMANSCDRWRLTEMPELPSWGSEDGRILLLGDCAHAMIPDAAQGYSQIIEDIAALDHLLTTCGDADMAKLARVWETVRKPRVERIKAFARHNNGLYSKGGKGFPQQLPKRSEPVQNGSATQLERSDSMDIHIGPEPEPDREAEFNTPPFNKWIESYDAVAEIQRYLEAHP